MKVVMGPELEVKLRLNKLVGLRLAMLGISPISHSSHLIPSSNQARPDQAKRH